MKKYLSAALAAVMLSALITPFAYSVDSGDDVIFSVSTAEEFKDVFSNPYNAEITDVQDITEAGSCVKLAVADGENYANLDFVWSDYKEYTSGYAVIETEFMPDGSSGINWFGIYTNQNHPVSGQLIEGNYAISTNSPVVMDEWNKLRIIVDIAQHKSIVYNNGVEISGWIPTDFMSDEFNTLRLYPYTDTTGNGVIYFKNYSFYITKDAGISAPGYLVGYYDGMSKAEFYRSEISDTDLNGELCSYIKGSDPSGSETDLFFNYTLPESTSGQTVTASIAFIPNDSVKEIHFATSTHLAVSPKVTMQAAEQDMWNTITLVCNPETSVNDLYLNGEYYGSTEKGLINGIIRVVVTASEEGLNNTGLYMDNYMICADNLTLPAITSDTLTVSNGNILGCGGLTVSEVISKLTLADDAYSAVVTLGGETVSEDTPVTDDMKLSVWKNDILAAQYYLKTVKYDLSNVIFYSNGYEDSKFNEGEFKAELDLNCYTGEKTVEVCLRQYNDDGSIAAQNINEYTVSGSKHIVSSLETEDVSGTYLKFTVTDIDSNESIYESEKIYPYSDSVIEKVSELYEGFTVKAATFSYDDGIPDDIALIELFDKYGIKGSFNLVGSRLERNYNELAQQRGIDVYSLIKQIYEGQEIQNHTYEHLPSFLMEGETAYDSSGVPLTGCTLAEAIEDVTKNKSFLYEKLGVQTRGIAWPNGYPQVRTDYSELEAAVMADGHEFARYKESGKFDLPTDWMRWQPTCHHNDAPLYTEKYVSMPNSGDLKLYYIWGHSYEFTAAGENDDKNLTMLENTISELYNSNVWFASNNEFYDYIHALDNIEITDTNITNNSKQTVYLHVNGLNISIEPGCTYTAGEPGEPIPERPPITPAPKLYTSVTDGMEVRAYTDHEIGSIVLASYDKDGSLINIVIGNGTEANINMDDAETVKAFLFESLSDMKPLTESVVINKQPTIACWGDSLTYGQGSTDPDKDSYPAVLSSLSGAKVYNMGVPGETSTTIAARQGVLKIELSKEVTIPSSGEAEISFRASNGGVVTPRDVTLGGWNQCEINGIKGKLEVTVDNTVWPRVLKSAKFIRATAGESITAEAGDELIPSAHSVRADINVIFSGTNGGWSAQNLTADKSRSDSNEIESLIDMIGKQAMFSNEPDKYIVIGLTTYDNEYWADVDAAMKTAFGERFFDLRNALADEELLKSHGITPTSKDFEYISRGAVPLSLLTADETHFNDNGYYIIAELLYSKMKELGYLS